MDETFERLRALDGKPVWVALVRAKDQNGPAVYRNGVFHLFAQPLAGEAPVTCVLDGSDLPIVTFLGTDTLSVVDDALRAELRPSFRIDVRDRPFPQASGEGAIISYEQATRELVAELEAGFRAALLYRPDPDPDASLRARYRVPPTEEGPLRDWSMRFAVGHNSATLRPHDLDIVRLTCLGSSVRNGRQVVDLFEPLDGADYALTSRDMTRLAANVRAFLAERRDRFRALARK
jgi:hypothetical protein